MKGDSHAFPFLLAAVASAAAALIPTPAAAQQVPCGQRDNVLGRLAQKYGESPVAIGVTSMGGLVEVLSTPDGKTWTIILSDPNGTSCLVASGEGWRGMARVEREPRV